MTTNNYIARLKAQLDQAIVQREHWKQLAEKRNSIVVTEVCPESRSVEEYIIDADSVRASWRLIRRYREQVDALRDRLLTDLTASAPNHSEQVLEEWKSGFQLHKAHKALDCGLPLPSYWAETCDGEPYVHTKLWRELPGCGSFHSSRFWPLYGVSMLAAAPSAGSQGGEA